MDKQQEQKNQNPNQKVEYVSVFLDENEVVNESEFEEQPEEQEAGKLADNHQKKPEEEEQPKKVKRPRKTIEQEIAELDAKRERLVERKRKQEAHEKIIFGATVIAMLKEMRVKNDKNREIIINNIINFSKTEQIKNEEIIMNIIQKYKI